MGMSYEAKADSTDMFVKVKLQDGTMEMHEVSLKKDKNVNFLNSGVGKFDKWMKEVPPAIDQKVYSKKQRERLVSAVQTLGKDVLASALNNTDDASQDARTKLKQLEKKGISLEDALGDITNKDKTKLAYKLLSSLANSGNKDAKKIYDEHIASNRKFAKDALESVATNEELQTGMLNAIKEEFPLKSVADGAETMAIGDMSLDVKTLEVIFATRNFDEIKTGLRSMTDKNGEPYLAYQAKDKNKKPIPIATVSIREPGIGYAGSFKFDMELHPEFAKAMAVATEEVYG